MPMTLQHERDNLYRVELGGTFLKEESDRCQEQLVDAIGRIGPIRLLFVLQDFAGWERGGNWNDLSVYFRYGDQIERIAIVGPERWRDETMLFAVAGLRRAPVEFFDEGSLAAARAWLSA